jgi:hypothetical protein
VRAVTPPSLCCPAPAGAAAREDEGSPVVAYASWTLPGGSRDVPVFLTMYFSPQIENLQKELERIVTSSPIG